LVYGTDLFTWEATVQTGMVVSAFAFGIVSQAAAALLARGFYALHDTKTPVLISISSIVMIIGLDFLFIKVLNTPVWGLAAAFSAGSLLQAVALYLLIHKKTGQDDFLVNLRPMFKQIVAAVLASGLMFVVLKFFDRSVWIKRLSFLGQIEATKYIAFDRFVLDTRYAANLLILTVVVTILGGLTYLLLAYLFKIHELHTFFHMLRRLLGKQPPLDID
jgi:putative peptidoglycan lipid II flippase